jgi:hypothetical protein
LVNYYNSAASAHFSGVAKANPITIDIHDGRQFSPDYDYGAMGTGRGFGFQATVTFRLSAIASDLGVQNAADSLFVFEIFGSSDGKSIDQSLLATSIPFMVQPGTGYQGQLFPFTFGAQQHYLVNFRRLDGLEFGSNLGTRYSWEDLGVFLPRDYGLITLIEGFEGVAPHPNNPLIPHMRLTAESVGAPIPEPTTVVMLGTGLAAMTVRNWRRRKSHTNRLRH